MTVLFKANHNQLNNSYQAGFTRTQIQDRTGVTSTSVGTAGGITTSQSPNNPVPAFNHPLLGNCLQHTLRADMPNSRVNYRQEAYHDTVARNLVDGDEMYFRFDFAVPSNFPVGQGNFFLCINQIHTANPSTSPPLEFDIYNGGLYTRGYNWETRQANQIRNKLTDVAPGKVYSVAYFVRFSSNSQNNRISVWVNGELVLSNFNPGFSLLDGGASYWKGSTLYADVAITRQYGELVVYQANHTAATELKDVLVATTPAPVDPDPPPTNPDPNSVQMPSDFAYAEVEISPTADFATFTVVDRLTGGGTAIATDLRYGDTYWVRARSVDWAGNKSPYSEVSQGKTERVANVDLGPDAVDTMQIRDLAVGRSQINDLAVNDAKIANLSVGKLTAGSLTANVITVGDNGRLSTGTDFGNRVSLDSQGLYSFVNGELKFWLKNNGEALVTGQISTAATGTRMTMNPGGVIPDEMRFYRFEADGFFARLRLIDVRGGTGLNIRSGGSGLKAETLVTPESAAMLYGNIESGIHRCRIVVDNDHAYVSAPVTDISADMRYPHDGVGHRISFFYLDPNGFLIRQSVIEMEIDDFGNAFTAPVLIANNRNVGLKFYANTLYVCDATRKGFQRMRALEYLPGNSSRELKQHFKTPEEAFGMRAIDVINASPVTQWEYIGDDKHVRHVGPVIEDVQAVAPELIAMPDDGPTFGLMTQAHMAWAGLQDLSKEVDELRALLTNQGN